MSAPWFDSVESDWFIIKDGKVLIRDEVTLACATPRMSNTRLISVLARRVLALGGEVR